MKTNRSPSQILAHERSRKARYRDTLYLQGWRQHTLWTTDDGWAQVLQVVKQVGPDNVRGGLRVSVVSDGPQMEAKVFGDGSEATPAYTSDTGGRL